jgi:parallel beta-helix repeat protein
VSQSASLIPHLRLCILDGPYFSGSQRTTRANSKESLRRSSQLAGPVRRCDLCYNGCTGMALGLTENCLVEDCTLLFNNYRRFDGDWGVAAGMKNIPGNRRTTIQRCEAAYNIQAEGIWFDTDNSDIRILDNVAHDNDDCGIFFEINRGGGIIAGNLVYQDGLDVAGPLPEEVTQVWRPQNPKRVGADLTQ